MRQKPAGAWLLVSLLLMLAAGSPRANLQRYHHFYDDVLASFRHVPGLRIMEIGVGQGESLFGWLQYFTELAPGGVQGLECDKGLGCPGLETLDEIDAECRRRWVAGGGLESMSQTNVYWNNAMQFVEKTWQASSERRQGCTLIHECVIVSMFGAVFAGDIS